VNLDDCRSHKQSCYSITDDKYKVEPLHVHLETSAGNYQSDVTLVTHVSINRIQILDKTLKVWKGPVSLVIHVPVKQMNDSLLDWQRYRPSSARFVSNGKLTMNNHLNSFRQALPVQKVASTSTESAQFGLYRVFA
jgi:hypothetical protein